MKIISSIQERRRDSLEEEKAAQKINQWLYNCEKTLNFLFENFPDDLSVEEAEEAFLDQSTICDPFTSRCCYDSSIVDVTDIVTGEKVGREALMGRRPRKCEVRTESGDTTTGVWSQGTREGQGTYTAPRLHNMGVNLILGTYTQGRIQGQGRLLMMDGTVRQGWFQHGVLHGPSRGFRVDMEHKLVWIGQYRAGRTTGHCWTSVQGGGWLVGPLSPDGQYTGSNIAFLYPDLSTALLGQFRNGLLVGAREAVVTSWILEAGVMVPSLTLVSDSLYCHWVSTKYSVMCPLHLQDPYEARTVTVKDSQVEGGGQGLYARKTLGAHTVAAFYNGVRIHKGDTTEPMETGTGTGYRIYVDWSKQLPFPFPWVKEGDQIDIPPQYQHTDNYTSTLAHKVNHSFTPNCEFVTFCHPCYGVIPAISTIVEVEAGQELTVHYNLNMEEAPSWYLQCWETQATNSNVLDMKD